MKEYIEIQGLFPIEQVFAKIFQKSVHPVGVVTLTMIPLTWDILYTQITVLIVSELLFSERTSNLT